MMAGTESTKNKIISDSVLGITILVTALAMWYLYREMDKVKHDVIYERRKARFVKHIILLRLYEFFCGYSLWIIGRRSSAAAHSLTQMPLKMLQVHSTLANPTPIYP